MNVCVPRVHITLLLEDVCKFFGDESLNCYKFRAEETSSKIFFIKIAIWQIIELN